MEKSWTPVHPEATKRNLLYEILARTRYDIETRGIIYTLRFLFNLIKGLATYPFYGGGIFTYRGEEHHYFHHWYNITHTNERCIEIPIIKQEVDKVDGSRVLEIGNVLSHYFPVKHTVIDKYETNIGVLNTDIMDYETNKKFDLIVSVSTMEHIGWDERPKLPDGAKTAMEKMVSLLNDGGKIIITIPIGYNSYLDEQIRSKAFPYTEIYCMKRAPDRNEWFQVDCSEMTKFKYGEPFPYASGVIILIYEKGETLKYQGH